MSDEYSNADRAESIDKALRKFAVAQGIEDEDTRTQLHDFLSNAAHKLAALGLTPADEFRRALETYEEERAEEDETHYTEAVQTLVCSDAFRAALAVVGLEEYATRPGVLEATTPVELVDALNSCAEKDGINAQGSILRTIGDVTPSVRFVARFGKERATEDATEFLVLLGDEVRADG
jgi:hypothetical protein